MVSEKDKIDIVQKLKRDLPRLEFEAISRWDQDPRSIDPEILKHAQQILRPEGSKLHLADLGPKEPVARGHLGIRRRRQATHQSIRTTPDDESLKRIEEQIARLYASGRIQVHGGRLFYKPGAREEHDSLQRQRDFISETLGPFRVRAGISHEILLNQRVYRFAPFLGWIDEYIAAISPERIFRPGPSSKRDTVVRLLWQFHQRAIIDVATATDRTRGPHVRCVDCGDVHRYLGRLEDEHGRRHCRQCGSLTHQRVDTPISFKPLRNINKSMLRRRFKLTRRQLGPILRP